MKKVKVFFILLCWLSMFIIVKTGLAEISKDYVNWHELMDPMNWNGDSCSYTVMDTSVIRNGETVTIDGGKIGKLGGTGGVRLHNDYKATTYIFRNVGISDIYVGVDDLFSDVFDYANRVYRIILEETAVVYGGINSLQTLNTTVELVNNGVIHSDNMYETLYVSLDGGSSFKLYGSGKIYLPETEISMYDFEPSTKGHLVIAVDGISYNDKEAIKQIIDTLKNVQIDFEQFQGEPVVYTLFGRIKDFYDREYFDLIVQDVKCILSNSDGLAIDDALQMIISSQEDDINLTLKSKIYWLENNKALCYSQLSDANSQSYRLKKPAQLFIPYPAGVTKDNADTFDFSIEYPVLDGNVFYSSADGTITATEYGLMVEVNEIIPFSMMWKTIEHPKITLPQTGDNSHFALWLALLTLTGTAILTLKRKTA